MNVFTAVQPVAVAEAVVEEVLTILKPVMVVRPPMQPVTAVVVLVAMGILMVLMVMVQEMQESMMMHGIKPEVLVEVVVVQARLSLHRSQL